MIGSAIPKNKIFREKDLKNIENTLKFEAENMKKQLHYDLVMMFLVFNYSKELYNDYLKNHNEEASFT